MEHFCTKTVLQGGSLCTRVKIKKTINIKKIKKNQNQHINLKKLSTESIGKMWVSGVKKTIKNL